MCDVGGCNNRRATSNNIKPRPQLCTRPRSISHDYQARQITDDEASCIVYRAKISCSMGLGTPSMHWRGQQRRVIASTVECSMGRSQPSTAGRRNAFACRRRHFTQSRSIFHSVSFSPFPSPNTIRRATIVVSPGEGHKKR